MRGSRTIALAMTATGPGTSRSPLTQRRTVRSSLSRSIANERADNPLAAIACRTSSRLATESRPDSSLCYVSPRVRGATKLDVFLSFNRKGAQRFCCGRIGLRADEVKVVAVVVFGAERIGGPPFDRGAKDVDGLLLVLGGALGGLKRLSCRAIRLIEKGLEGPAGVGHDGNMGAIGPQRQETTARPICPTLGERVANEGQP